MSDANKPTLAAVVKLGAALVKPGETTKRAFYDACAAYVGDATGKTLTALITKVVAKGRETHGDGFPSVATVKRFTVYARRFPTLPADTSLEVAAKFAAQAGTDADGNAKTFDYVIGEDDAATAVSLPITDDDSALAALAQYRADTGGKAITIGEGRALFSDGEERPALRKGDVLDVDDVMVFLLSQPLAVVEWAMSHRDEAETVAKLLLDTDTKVAREMAKSA